MWQAGRLRVATNARGAAKIEVLLAEAGSDKTGILNTTIWLSDIAAYDEMNAVWDAWIPQGAAPARACGEIRLGGVGYDVEFICVAAVLYSDGQC